MPVLRRRVGENLRRVGFVEPAHDFRVGEVAVASRRNVRLEREVRTRAGAHIRRENAVRDTESAFIRQNGGGAKLVRHDRAVDESAGAAPCHRSSNSILVAGNEAVLDAGAARRLDNRLGGSASCCSLVVGDHAMGDEGVLAVSRHRADSSPVAVVLHPADDTVRNDTITFEIPTRTVRRRTVKSQVVDERASLRIPEARFGVIDARILHDGPRRIRLVTVDVERLVDEYLGRDIVGAIGEDDLHAVNRGGNRLGQGCRRRCKAAIGECDARIVAHDVNRLRHQVEKIREVLSRRLARRLVLHRQNRRIASALRERMLHLVRAGRQIDRAIAVEIPRVLADVVLADAGDLKGHRHRHDSLAHVGLEAERERGGVVFVSADVDRAVHDAGKVSKVQGWRIGHLRALGAKGFYLFVTEH